jgi:hypothetical protein
MHMSEHWIGKAVPREHPDQKPETIDSTREEVEKWARKWRAVNYEVKIYPKP